MVRITYYSIVTASNENTQNPDVERVERRRRTRRWLDASVRAPIARRIPPSSRDDGERTNADRRERTRQKKLPTHPASSVLRLARARIARASTPRAPAALVPAGAAGGGVRARAPTGGARAASGALIARHDEKSKTRSFVRSFVRSRVVSRARECGDAPSTSIRRGCVRSIEPSRDASCVRRVMTREQSPRPPRARRVPSTDRRRSVAVGRLPTSHDSTRALHTATTRTRKSKPPVSPHR